MCDYWIQAKSKTMCKAWSLFWGAEFFGCTPSNMLNFCRSTWWEFLCSFSVLWTQAIVHTQNSPFNLDSYTTKWKVLWDGAQFFLMPAPFSSNDSMQNIRGISCLEPTYPNLCLYHSNATVCFHAFNMHVDFFIWEMYLLTQECLFCFFLDCSCAIEHNLATAIQ